MIKVNKNFKIFYIFSFVDTELCCSFCYFINLHKNHKLIPINDEESLKKENIIIEDSFNEFNEYFEKINRLKEKTEKEMLKLDHLYDNTLKNLENSFEEKHLDLNKKENEIKDKLQIEVTKVKEKLEQYLSKFNYLINSCEKINKGLKSLEKQDKQMIQVLSYVSKINKNKREMKDLLQKKIINLKMEYIKEENNIKYTQYYFNGLQYKLKDIEIYDIMFDKFKVRWQIDNPKDLNIKIDKDIIFRVEIRKENSNDIFKIAYEGNDKNCLVKNLESETTYEVQICIIYNDVQNDYSKIYKAKTKEVDSLILKESKRANEFLKKIYEFIGNKSLELIYRGTRDGMNSFSFHNKCDNKGPTISLYKNNKGHIFGAYAAISWTNSGEWKTAPLSYLFTLTNMHNSEPMKFEHTPKESIYSVYHHNEFGPSFGSGRDISIASDFALGESYANFPYTYIDNLGKGASTFSSELKSNRFKLKEIEVFKLT